jgi:hypothetical protein
LVIASCGRTVRDKMYVEKVENSDDSDYLYRVTIDSDMNDGVTYYTNYKYEVGDSLASIGEFNFEAKEKFVNQSMLVDSLRAQNDNLKKENQELKLFNGLLINVIKDSIKK